MVTVAKSVPWGNKIALTRCELDADAIRPAALRARVIFSDEHLPEPPHGPEGASPMVR